MAENVLEKPRPDTEAWYTLAEDDVTQKLSVQPDQGLDDAEAARRLEQYGPNELIDRGAKNPFLILWEQITDPLVIVLLAAALVSALLGKWQELIAIMAIVVINAILGVVQEYRAEQAMQALKNMAAPLVRVRRGNKIKEIESRSLVPGDVILLETGNIIPADGRLVESANLKAQEASLTGESEAVEKFAKKLEQENIPVGDRVNMVYMGTSATYGRGTAIITATGMQTELGRIAQLIQEVEADQTPLQRRMAEVGKVMFWAAVAVAVLAFIIGALESLFIAELSFTSQVNTILLNAVAIAVAVVPEGLPAVVTVSLALGTQRMLRRKALIRKLPATETLGSVTVICSDKTGTLTENRMTVKVVDVPGETYDLSSVMQNKLPKGRHLDLSSELEGLLLLSGTMVNDSTVERVDRDDRDYMVQGDPTEGAIALAAARFGLVKHEIEKAMPRIGEVPFSSERKLMTTVHQVKDDIPMDDRLSDRIDDMFDNMKYVAFTKGAPDRLIGICDRVWEHGKIEAMTDATRERIENANGKLANEGLRVLAVAFRELEELPAGHEEGDWEEAEKDLVFAGLVGIIDPPRPEVADAVATCKTAGIRVKMITGDHPITAKAIARDLGIIEANEQAIIGQDIEAMSDDELRETVKTVSVFARVSPEHKLRIVRALKDNGEIVAMTGDGVNDAPALKQADIGVAMSITGTDVSKEAADMVILDDNFATIVSASEEGRTIYDNVRRFIKYLLASNTGELFVLLVMQGIPGIPLPLNTLQILWMNLITDGVPALALGVEQPEKNSMKRPPYAPNESVFGRGLGRHILIVGMVLGISALSLGLITFNMNLQSLSSQCMQDAGIGFWSLSLGNVECDALPNAVDANGDLATTSAWNTMVFIMLTLAQMGHAYGLRSHKETVFRMNPTGNRFLLYALLVTVAIQISTVYLPFFNDLFGTRPLTLGQLLLCLALSTLVFVAVEIEKLLIRRGVLSAGESA
jgi:Ca2+-transporting ATPase